MSNGGQIDVIAANHFEYSSSGKLLLIFHQIQPKEPMLSNKNCNFQFRNEMWPSSKNSNIIEQMESTAKTIICIPGNWKDRPDLVEAIVEANRREYIYVGLLIMNIQTKETFQLEAFDPDARMRETFEWAGQLTGILEDTLDVVEDHAMVVYISGETGSFKAAESIARAAGALLKAGGLGIKVETAGKAFDKHVWLNYLENFEPHLLYEMFVVDSIAEEDGTVFSSGMHNLGFKDTIVSGEEFQYAVDLIKTFSFYQIVDKPALYPHQTFATSDEDPTFEIIEELNQPYKGDELFENPYGMWRLKRLVNDRINE